MPRRLLVIANETLSSPNVLDELRYWAEGPGTEIVVVVPMRRRGPLSRLTGGDDDAARQRAQGRMEATISALSDAGLRASGQLGDEDPLLALSDAVAEVEPDAIVISTHPPGRSRWLQFELVARARADYPVPVHHIVIDLNHGGQTAHTDPRSNRGAQDTIRLFHVADYEDAMSIRHGGFTNRAATQGETASGVWVTDRAGARAHAEHFVFQVEIPRATAEQYERESGSGDERRFLVPASVLNESGPITDIADDTVE